jgi:hypothetical protein
VRRVVTVIVIISCLALLGVASKYGPKKSIDEHFCNRDW